MVAIGHGEGRRGFWIQNAATRPDRRTSSMAVDATRLLEHCYGQRSRLAESEANIAGAGSTLSKHRAAMRSARASAVSIPRVHPTLEPSSVILGTSQPGVGTRHVDFKSRPLPRLYMHSVYMYRTSGLLVPRPTIGEDRDQDGYRKPFRIPPLVPLSLHLSPITSKRTQGGFLPLRAGGPFRESVRSFLVTGCTEVYVLVRTVKC